MSEQNEVSDEMKPIRMKVIGVGGAGSNIIDRLMLSNPSDVHLTAINTDQQALANSPVIDKHCIGKTVTRGLGAGGDPEVGREAALADKQLLEEMVKDVDLLFLTAGLGGGTGTGVAPVLADIAAQKGATVIVFVTLPFTIERAARSKAAKAGLDKLREVANAVIPLPNDLLIQESEPDASLLEAFSQADAWVEKAIKSIWSMMNKTGLINLDFSQLQQVFANRSSKTLFGLGEGTGEDATNAAIADLKLCPLLHTPEFSKKADQLLVNLIGGTSLGISETQRIMDSIADAFGKDANVVMGAVIDESMGHRVEICVIGTSGSSDVTIFRGRRRMKKIHSANLVEPDSAEIPEKKSRKSKKTHDKSQKTEQHEFSFSEGEPRGEFENTEGTMFEGQDLDTPTFLRRGVRIPI